ncbi:RloB family protein [Trueperella bialowiezensis]|uniref:RloB-like protein n=1 Tax=Trueperella bialowiezensis TaxID=312285 RepID=A0A3S5EW48_9ACTO|nr:RloB family protein [Trueperella bialowiezensis]VEI13741.1 Uncharacterised protein [Trueperella bialowiezensis]
MSKQRKRGRNAYKPRSRPVRRKYRKVLVVVEGSKNKSEQAYFEQLNQELRQSASISIVVEAGEGEPSKVLRACQRKTVQEQERTGDSKPFDIRVLVVDVDEHAKLPSVLEQCEKEGIHALVTNPRFELWLLWHKEDYTRAASAQDIDARVRRLKLVGGSGGKELGREFLITNYAEAIQRARRAWPELSPNHIGPDPSSAIPWLIDKLSSG